ncbi:hypothetical protein [Nocardioides pakistanensis]
MTTFREQDHPRARGGKFAVKEQAEATGVTLACDPDDMADPETFEMLWCEQCSLPFEESEATRLYECSNCGTTGPDRRCDQCHKFMARSEEPGCPQCEEKVDENPVAVVRDHDGAIILAEDYEPDGPSKAERDVQARAEAAEKAEADRVARLAEKQQNTTVRTAADIAPGSILIDPEDDSRFATAAEVLSVRRVDTPDGPIVIFKTYEYSPRTVVRRADAPVPTQETVTDRPTVTRTGEQVTAADFGGAYLVDGFNEDLGAVSSPHTDIDVLVGSSSRDHGTLPTVALMTGRRNRQGDLSGSVSFLGRWDDPEKAAAALDEIERAANALAAARTEHPPADVDDLAGRRSRPGTTQHRETDWVSGDEMRTVRMEVGLSDWHEDSGALLSAQAPGGLSLTFDDPAVLKSAVAEARKHLGTLTGIPTRPDVVDDKI